MLNKIIKISRLFIKVTAFAIITAITAFFILNLIFPLPINKLERSKSVMVYDKDNELLRAYTTNDGMWRSYASFDDMPPLLISSLITYEDKRFYRHAGIDPIATIRALWQNIRAMKIVSGASTITMQIARMIEPKDRTIWAKFAELFRSVQIEQRYSKDEILEIYLNIAPFGGNIEGIASASYIYFNKPYTQLSTGEVAILVGLPNSPTKYRPDIYPDRAKKQRDKILNILNKKNIITKKRMHEALSEPIPRKRYDMPFEAPHLSDYLKLKYSNKIIFHTTIDSSVQKHCEHLLKKNIDYLKQRGIHNGAIIVIDNETRDVSAFVGSAGYFDEENQGQVNGAVANRSPGSALKPFVYALACEEGIIGTGTMLVDLPEDFSGFEPKNYDKKYRGMISASEALSMSLNIPAVSLMRRLKQKNLYNTLKEGGLSTIVHEENHYGLSLILGGAEVKLVELTNLYATLANGGTHQKYNLEKDDRTFNKLNTREIFMPESCYLVSEMLAEDHYLSERINWKTTLGQHKIAWKTGTSYSHRDAWSIGYDRYYTVGVWVGNFDNRESSDIVGINVATPIMFDIFKAITKVSSPKWFDKPNNVDTRMVSVVSGKVPREFDTATKSELYIKGVTSEEKCGIKQKMLIDKETGYRLYYHCLEGKDYETKIMDIYPGKVRSWLLQSGFPVESIPKVHPDCKILIESNGPKIDSPSDNSTYYLRNDLTPEEQQIIFKAHPEKGNNTVYWFINDKPFASSKGGEDLLYTPEEGTHKLVAMDEEGRTTKISFSVQDVTKAVSSKENNK